MKLLRISIVAVITLGILTAVVVWNRSAATGFSTPEECVNAFYDSCLDQDQAGMSRCLTSSLQKQISDLAREKNDIKQLMRDDEVVVEDAAAMLTMDEIRTDSTQRVRYRLQKQQAGWLINFIGSPETVKLNVPHGTHISKVPEP